MPNPRPVEVPMPVLLRQARSTYASTLRGALAEAGYDDLPANGLYVVGGLAARGAGRPLGELIAELRVSKQAGGQLVDALVARGYLERQPDPADRRRLTVLLTERGRGAARVLAIARMRIDALLLARTGPRDLERARKVLGTLVEIGRELDEADDRGAS